VTEPILIALISALFGGFLGNFLSYRLKKRTDYMDIVNTVLQRSDHDLKQWAERITRLESELDLKRQENTALEIKVEVFALSPSGLSPGSFKLHRAMLFARAKSAPWGCLRPVLLPSPQGKVPAGRKRVPTILSSLRAKRGNLPFAFYLPHARKRPIAEEEQYLHTNPTHD